MYACLLCICTGANFWRTSKRIRAVKKSEYRKQNHPGSSSRAESSSDSDFEPPPHKLPKVWVRGPMIDKEERLQKLEHEVRGENVKLKIEAHDKERQVKESRSQLNV